MKYSSVGRITQILSVSALTLALWGCGGSTETNTEIPVVDTSAPVVDEGPGNGWELVWEDEFDGDNINLDNWTQEVNCLGGGNQEKQCYTEDPANSFVSEGMLNIVALPASPDAGLPLPYTSARLNSRGKADFTYGRFEMRAKLPRGQGSWPAFWLLFSNETYGIWPQSGEIDIMEAVNLGVINEDGTEETDIFGTIHYGDLFPNNQQSGLTYTPPGGVNPADDFHTYAIEWQEGEIRWYMDGLLYATQRQPEVRLIGGEPNGLVHRGWYLPQFSPITGEPEVVYGPQPFDHDFHIILNLAVGGSFPENTNNGGIDPTAFENGQTFQIDYVRVYECSADVMTGRGCETVRNGWDQYRFEETGSGDDDFGQIADENGALIRGKAPIPRPPAPPTAQPLTIFADGENPDWPLWDDCCGPAESEVTTDDLDPSRGAVAEFRILDNSGTVLGFNSRNADGGPYNASALVENGIFKFDMRIVNGGAANDWLIKIEGNNMPSPAFEVNLNTSLEGVDPVVGEWQTYTFNVSDIADSGLDFSAIDVIMVFPAWQTGEGTVYRIDNVEFTLPGGVASPELNVFIDETDADWGIFDDCCGPASSAVIPADDATRGNVVEFEILDGSGTVLGFNARAGYGSGTTFDATPIFNSGVLQFDMLVKSAGAASDWLVKVEGNGIASPAFEVNLNTSMEGVDPVVGEWQTYTFPISAIADGGTDISALDVILVFPAWMTGEGAVYQLDNVRVYDPNSSGGGATGPVLELFSDGPNEGWPMWDCCGEIPPEVVMDDAEHGTVALFQVGGSGETVQGFNGRDSGNMFDASQITTTGVFQFEMKVVSAPADLNWLIKLEADNNTSFAEVNVNSSMEGIDPVIGEWQTYTFDLLSLVDAGLDVGAIDIVMIFPTWGTGSGSSYMVDNVYIGNPADIGGNTGGGNGGGNDDVVLAVFYGMESTDWPIWDNCCGPAESEVVMADDRGGVVEFRVLDGSGTVLGFNNRPDQGGSGMPFDASGIAATGKLSFDMRIVSAGAASDWLIKIEGNNTPSPAFEVNLNQSNEGADPVVGEWQTYTFDILDILDGGTDISAIDVILVFPAWATGDGAVYQLDNVVFTRQ